MSGFSRNDPNIAMLEHVAVRLGVELCRRVVFVGGAAAGLLITDLAAPTIRRTDDVDIVDPALVLEEFQRLEAQLRAMGFEHDHSSDVICRWIIDGVSVDIMPSREEILGFTNKWYPLGIETSVPYALGNGMEIRVIRAPELIATKLEAFHERGSGITSPATILKTSLVSSTEGIRCCLNVRTAKVIFEGISVSNLTPS